MSGGFYDYLNYDAEEVGRRIAEVREDAREDDAINPEVVERLAEMENCLMENAELLRAIEWYKSGDVGADAISEEFTPNDPEFVVDGRFTSEGLSVSAYTYGGNVLDESWFTYDEIELLANDEESNFTFEL